VALGLPAVTLPNAELDRLMDAVELDPAQELVLDLAAGTITSRAGVQKIAMPDGARRQLLEGNWDATAVLLEARDAIQATAARLPYVGGF
jgi:3-isopropylmalate/(R)-2-methylmalate dehydratase small subunit